MGSCPPVYSAAMKIVQGVILSWARVGLATLGMLAALSLGRPAAAQLPSVNALLSSSADVVQNDQVRAQLVVHAPQGLQPGQAFEAGLLLEHAPHWHTYWQNPGDSGLPTRLSWTLPEGVQAEEVAWPLPRKFPIGTLANYGYEGRVLLPVRLTIAASTSLPQRWPLVLKAEWLACRQECIPQEALLRLDVTTGTPITGHQALFASTRTHIPRPLPAHEIKGLWRLGGRVDIEEDGRQLRIRMDGLPADWRGQTLSLFPVTANVVHNAARQNQDWTQRWEGGIWTARVPVSAERAESPTEMQWVLARGPESAPLAPALEIRTDVRGHWPASAAHTAIPEGLARALEDNAARSVNAVGNNAGASTLSLTLALLGALVGGLILNLMPCVFPVLAIKVLGFARPGLDARQHRAAGLAYTLGAVASFVLLGALMLALRAAGEQLGWGFQLQSPVVVSALAVLFTLLGLNLTGLFEFGTLLPSGLASVQSRHPTVDAALSGVLAVAIASPCTAPFMGASLGLAIGLPAWQALPVFAAMGLGMALPYLAVSFWPALAHRLPRPGPWMQTFRQFMAFPMLATVIWLLWVLGLQTGMDVVALLLAGLLTLALLLWALQQTGRTRLSMAALAMVLLAALVWQGRGLKPDASAPVSSAGRPGENSNSTRWQVWSPTQLDAALTAGKPVFVDFTAAWCVTCQYNKKTVLADDQVLAAFDRHGVVTLRADWTRRDEAITRALNALGRSGVPVYALYRPGQPPRVLSELPSVREVVDALSVKR